MLKLALISRLDRHDVFNAMRKINKIERKIYQANNLTQIRNYSELNVEKGFLSSKTKKQADFATRVKYKSSFTSFNKIPLSSEIEEEKQSLFNNVKSKEQLNRDQEDLLSYLDVCINLNMNTLAHESLQYYHDMYQSSGMPMSDIRLYNRLLDVYAAKGERKLCKNLLEMIKNGNVKPNLQTYVYAIECAYRKEKNNLNSSLIEHMKKNENFKPNLTILDSVVNYYCQTNGNDVIRGILKVIEADNLDIFNMFNECTFDRDQREFVLKAISSEIGNFKPLEKKFSKPYINCIGNLLTTFNEDLPSDRFYSPVESNEICPKLKDLVQEEVEREKIGFVKISRIDHTPEFRKENEKLIKKLEKYELDWKKEMLLSLQEHLIDVRKQFHDTSIKKMNILPYLSCLSPNEIVDIMFQTFLQLTLTTFSVEISTLHAQLGKQVMDKYLLQKKLNSFGFQHTMELYEKYCHYFANPELTSRYSSRQYWELLKKEYSNGPDEQTEIKWPTKVITEIGEIMFNIMKKVIKLDWNYLEDINDGTHNPKRLTSPFMSNDRAYQGIEIPEIKGDLSVRKYCGLINAGEFTINAFDLPMLSPPIPWNSLNSGGFLLNHSFSSYTFLRSDDPNQHHHIQQTNVQNLYPQFDSLNHLADCPWKINKKILNTVLEIFKPWDNPTMDSFVPHQTETNKEVTRLLFGGNQAKRFEIVIFNWLRKISIANAFRDRVFWFPHSIDFRGRAYPMQKYFSYTYSDVDRGLLLFAKGQLLGKDGLDWLKIHLVNTNGGSKKRTSLKEKLEYCDKMLPEIMDSADNPLTGNGWWKKSDNPWQTLASCIELTAALRSPDPRAYICHLPVQQDGSCNVLQHYSALGRDLVTATEVNLTPNDAPRDFYSKVSSAFEQVRKKDAETGNLAAKSLDGITNRKFMKIPVMSLLYDRNLETASYNVAVELRREKSFSYDHRQIASEYLISKLFTQFKREFSKVQEIRNWLIKCAASITQVHNQPIDWVTPIGLPIIQPYLQFGQLTKKANYRIPTKEINVSKQSAGFPANFVQSLDATHMKLTSLACHRKGITFVSVHDSFWTHPNNVTQMNQLCREQFYELHKEPLLESLSEYLMKQFCKESHNDSNGDITRLREVLSDIPSQGSFDLKNVLKATYFFS